MEIIFGFEKNNSLVLAIRLFIPILFISGWALILTSGAVGMTVGFILLGIGLSTIWILFPSHYRIDERFLSVRAGPLRWRIPLADIISVRPCRCLPSPTTWTFESLRVDFKRKGRTQFMFIAPLKRQAFLEKLAATSDRFEQTVDGLELSDTEQPRNEQ